jgi:hypothetical protein
VSEPQPSVGAPVSDQEILGLLRSLRGLGVAFMLVVTSDLRIGTFPEYRPTPQHPTLPDFLHWLADQAIPTTPPPSGSLDG